MNIIKTIGTWLGILFLCWVVFNSRVVRADGWEIATYTAIVADTATTMYALDNGAVEGNPVYGKKPSDAILLGSTALQLGLTYWVNRNWNATDAHRFNVIFSTFKFSAVANNIYVIWEYDL